MRRRGGNNFDKALESHYEIAKVFYPRKISHQIWRYVFFLSRKVMGPRGAIEPIRPGTAGSGISVHEENVTKDARV